MPDRKDFLIADEFTDFFRTILQELQSRFTYATSMEQERLLVLLSQYRRLLREVSSQADSWIEKNIDIQVRLGQSDGLVNLRDLIPQTEMVTTFSQVHEGAISEVVSAMKHDYRKVLSVHENSLKGFIQRIKVSSDAQKGVLQEIATSVAFGDSSQLTSRRIESRLVAEAIGGYVKVGNKTLRIDQYAELLARTELRVAYSRGATASYLANGLSLIIISEHATECKLCGPIEGKIFSLRPNHPTYPHVSVLPNHGTPIHPNCLHVMLPFVPELASQEELTDGTIDKSDWPFKETREQLP